MKLKYKSVNNQIVHVVASVFCEVFVLASSSAFGRRIVGSTIELADKVLVNVAVELKLRDSKNEIKL